MKQIMYIERLKMKSVMKKVALAALLVCGTVGANGQDFYVIKAGNNFLAHTNATTIGNATTFNANTCLWTINGNNIIAISPDGTLGNYLSYVSGNNYALSLRNDGNYIDWTGGISDGGEPYYAIGYYNNYYLRYRNNAWGVSNNTTHGVFTKLSYSDAANTSSTSTSSYSATLDGDGVIYSTSGTHTYTADVTQTITYAQTNRTFSGYANSGTTTATINKPYSVSSAFTGATNVAWSVSPTTYGTINATTGVLTITSLPTSVATITINYTAQAGGKSVTGTKQVMLAKDSSTAEDVAGGSTGVTSNTVTLNDFEDHSWSYYSDPSCPIRSLNPANVKITYEGYGAKYTTQSNGNPTGNLTSISSSNATVQVGILEAQHTFVYYKTLERTDGQTAGSPSGRCEYRTIPNPFSVRPRINHSNAGGTGNSATNYTGFYMWRLKTCKGGNVYTTSTGGTALTPGTSMVDAEQRLYFAPEKEYGMTVEFEAIWAPAYVTGNTHAANHNAYERNFYIGARTSALDYAATITAIYPDGTNGSNRTLLTAVPNTTQTSNYTCSADTKFENIRMGADIVLTANNHYLCVGRGCGTTNNVMTCVRGMGDGSRNELNYTLRIESGKYSYMSFVKGTFNNDYASITLSSTSANSSVRGILGCDYDRAKGDNSNLRVNDEVAYGCDCKFSFPKNTNFLNVYVKSGEFGYDGYNNLGDGGSNTLYMGVSGRYANATGNMGLRTLTIEGGKLCHIAGGVDDGNQTDTSFYVRMMGGEIVGALYGAAAFAETYGHKKYVITGGKIRGWVAGGCNGTTATNNVSGVVHGSTFMYIGGTSVIGYDDGTTPPQINSSTGGVVFGAGSGNVLVNTGTNAERTRYATVGQVDNSTIVLSDDSYVQSNVYGGGNFGYVNDTGSSIHVLGGIVGGNVFGGSNQRTGKKVDIIMKDGTIKGGIYGGSNILGVVDGPVTIQVNGGQVGTTETAANIHGGGYGNATNVSGNVSVTLGTDAQTTPGVTLYGDVYGGSALGIVNTNASNYTNVTMNAGTVYGSVYGGGLGNSTYQANVNGTVAVVVNGGSVKTTDVAGSGSVFGCNNVSGAPQSTVSVTIHGTDAAAAGEYAIDNVYGGGNAAAYTGNPVVTVDGTKTNCAVDHVYGGGLGSSAVVTGNTSVTISGGRAGYVFGGGSQANVTGSVAVSVSGGVVDDDVYGGGAMANTNTSGGTTTSVNLTGGKIGNAYGGGLGDLAAIGTGHSDVAALVMGNVTVTVDGTAFNIATDEKGIVTKGRVFGCNNLNGTPKGHVKVWVKKTVNPEDGSVNHKPTKNTETYEMASVYGGGNQAAYEPTTNQATEVIIDGCGQTSIAYVYGGGNAAPVPATNVKVNGSYEIEYVFGGGNGKDQVKVGNTYQDNPGADVGKKKDGTSYGVPTELVGTAKAEILGGVIHHVFGGSNTKGDVTKSATVVLGDQNLQTCEFEVDEVYGAGNEAYMSGDASIDMNCIEGLSEIYGGSRRANVKGNVELNITGGSYKRVFGGNNETGNVQGSITVNIKEEGCLPIRIGELYGGGNLAAYSVYGYEGTNEDGAPITSGTAKYADPVINVISATKIGTIYGGGLGKSAVVYGSPHVNVNMEPGKVSGRYEYVQDVSDPDNAAYATGTETALPLGEIGTVYGGGNAAKVVGKTYVHIGTAKDEAGNALLRKSAQITGDVFGGGNEADVTGNTEVIVGEE